MLTHFILFALDNRQFALPLERVERVVRAVEVTPLPQAPDVVRGLINLEAKVVPVFDIRKRFGLLSQEIEPHHHFIIAHTRTRLVVLMVDAVRDTISLAVEKVVAAEQVVPGMEYIEGVARLEDELVLIHDIDRFLSLEEEQTLDKALEEKQHE